MDSSAHRISIKRDLLLLCPCCFLFGGSKFYLGGSDRTGYSQQRFQSLEVLRFFSEVPNFEI
jgi:hypothetical protein